MFGEEVRIKKTSAWTFNTSGTGGLGLGFFAAVGGELVLKPPSGPLRGFWFGTAGVGIGAGIKRIPKIGRIIDSRGLSEKGSANAAPKSFWNHGVVYVMDGLTADELTATTSKASAYPWTSAVESSWGTPAQRCSSTKIRWRSPLRR